MAQIRPIDNILRTFIADRGMKVLRNKYTHKALNASYTEEGLKWSINKYGKSLYYKRAYLSKKNGLPKITGDLRISPHVYVEDFVPRDHDRWDLQIAEFLWVDKALRLLYHVKYEEPNQGKIQVY